jgi:UPF0755 protein
MKILTKMVTAVKELTKFIFVFLIFFAVIYLSRDLRINSSTAIVAEDVSILLLEERIGLDELIETLEHHEIDFNSEELRWVSSLLGWRTFATGRYELEGNYSYNEFLSKMALGLQDHAPVTIHPGINIDRLSASLGRQMLADSSDFAAVFTDSSDLMIELGYSPETLFSRMLPDTYHIYWTNNAERVIRRVYNEFKNRVENRLAEDIEASNLDLNQILTLASIIEWEARFRDEKSRISGLYWNRLNRGMRLQADPTVIYAIGEHRRLLYEDYQFDHPYNTYLIDGLPPGPITNPDLYSIRAAITPEDHDYLYMVASPDGGHVFTRTFEEHRVASSEWRRWIQEQFRIRDELDRQESSN